ncbi:hypothetical protein SCP_0300610 [Sparassis crispa]|uniref:Uncharacterized protein n=1 Tax=Sparassis crispa TaxID=139825 RepID=A0A401GDU4_9APHY|nr:hypothetical protein SCP_0300610 [Sparassis crispa]GBE80346.1 hypothetical protein SCP_0300610 [Sparassis crispa]
MWSINDGAALKIVEEAYTHHFRTLDSELQPDSRDAAFAWYNIIRRLREGPEFHIFTSGYERILQSFELLLLAGARELRSNRDVHALVSRHTQSHWTSSVSR